MLKPFRIEDIARLDNGRPAAMVNQAIQQVVKDCVDRPIEKVRKVAVVLEITPQIDSTGVVEEVTTEVVVSATVPKSYSKPFVMSAKPSGSILFNDMSPDNPSQRTIDEVCDGDNEMEL